MSLKIIKNKHLKIKKEKMKCDPKLPDGILAPLQDSNFFYIISAPPGSGKSTMILNLLKGKKFYRRKFDKIYFISPSAHTIKNLPLPEDQIIPYYDPELVKEIIQDINDDDDMENKNILFIFDDVVTALQKNDRAMLSMIYNRRHLIMGSGDTSLSIIITTQKLNKIPLEIRAVPTAVFIYQTNSAVEQKIICDEFINLPPDICKELLKNAFEKPHSFLFIDCTTQNAKCKYYINFHKVVIELD